MDERQTIGIRGRVLLREMLEAVGKVANMTQSLEFSHGPSRRSNDCQKNRLRGSVR